MSRYAEVHKPENLKGPGDARPTALDIIRDEKREDDLKGKVAVITGCSSGIGPPAAVALAKAGFELFCTARDLEKTKKALKPLLEDPSTAGHVHLVHMDQTSLASVKKAADEIKAATSTLNLLVNNAGIMMVPERRETEDGFELQIGTNHFSHFYLFCLLKDLLVAGSKASPAYQSRVVNVSSSGHRWTEPDLDDLQLAKPGAYSPIRGYAASKTANIWMANELTRRYGHGDGPIQGYSLMPGGIRTGLERFVEDMLEAWISEVPTIMKSPEQGAATTAFAAVARELEGKGGVFLENCAVAPQMPEGLNLESIKEMAAPGYRDFAFSPAKETALWNKSLKAVGLPEDF